MKLNRDDNVSVHRFGQGIEMAVADQMDCAIVYLSKSQARLLAEQLLRLSKAKP